MKNIVFGIALIVFGFCLFCITAEIAFVSGVALLTMLVGLVFAIIGYVEREK